ncbi:phage tail protein [Acidaminococcus fermentans]|uniref:phage tail protein n=1 Tax=Acidaminococcus fermentans TaxID=905 RepID=UPI00265D90F4|nr:phage tail protein [Acidaminococcus fermentans]
MGLFRGRTVTTRANKISDFTVATASYGGAVPVVYGTSRLAGNVIYYDDFTAHEHRETQRTGKGGKSKSVSITYTYTVAVILGLCEGPIHSVGKVWLGKDVYQYPSDQIGMTLYDGSQKAPWPYVKGKHPDKALTYENLAYMAGVIDLGDSGSMPDYNFEVRGMLTDTGDGTDANPADVIRDILDKVGLSSVEIIGLDNYRKYCREADLLISSPTDTTEAKAAHDIINELMTLTNAYMFWSNNKFKIVCKADRPVGSWIPDTTIQYDLTADDFLESNGALVTCQRKDSSEIYNRFPVEFISRKNSYETETVAYELKDDIAEYGLRQASSTTAHWFYTKERAVKVAEQLARDALYGRNKFTFKLDWAFCRLEVGDLVTLTDSALGLDKTPVMIDSVTENTDGTLTFTAISRPPMKASKPAYDVHEGDRPYIDYNADAPDTDTPLIMQPPAELTTSGLEVWIGAKGKGDLWGGCEVYVADDGTNYRAAGTVASSARVGTLAKSIKATDTSMEVACNGTFLSGSQQDAERGNTLCWIDGECLSYQGATLLDNGHWRLDGCIRGQHTTTAAAHDAGAQFARLDASLLRIPFLSEDVGKKVYLKFVSFNVFGSGVQDLAGVKAYEYTIKKYYIPAVKNVRAYNRYRHLADGVSRYDVVVQWDPPDLESYAAGQVWYRTNAGQVQDLTAISGVPASELGYYGKWIFGGQGKNEVVIPQAVVGDTYEIAVTTVDKWAASTDPDIAPKVKITVAMRTMVPNTPDGFTLAFGKTATAAWNEVTNTDVMYYEVRRDNAPGAETAGLLARTNGTSANVGLNARTGRLYLFARNALGKYSVPAVLDYNKTAPGKPDAPTVKNTMTGFSVAGQGIPGDAIGMMVYINDGDAVKTENAVMSYNCEPGIYDVAIAYYDMFGAGERSATTRTVVKIIIDETNIKDMAISLQKVDKTIQDAVKEAQGISGKVAEIKQTTDSIQATVADDKKELASQITQNADKITSVVTNLGDAAKAKEAYSAIAQMQDDIALRVKSGEIISQINLSKEGVQIDGKLLHVTGDTVFDKNVVVKDMIQAGAVTADKMAVDALSAITANVGSLKGGTITGTQIVGTNFRNSSGSFTVDDSGNITGATLKSGTIDGNTIRINGYNVRAVSILKGRLFLDDDNWDMPTDEDKHNGIGSIWANGSWHHADHTGGRYIPIPAGYDRNQCIWGISNDASTILASYCYYPNPGIPYVECHPMGSGGYNDGYVLYWCIGIK